MQKDQNKGLVSEVSYSIFGVIVVNIWWVCRNTTNTSEKQAVFYTNLVEELIDMYNMTGTPVVAVQQPTENAVANVELIDHETSAGRVGIHVYLTSNKKKRRHCNKEIHNHSS